MIISVHRFFVFLQECEKKSVKNSEVIFWKKQTFPVKLSARGRGSEAGGTGGFRLFLTLRGHPVGKSRTVPIILVPCKLMADPGGATEAGLCGKLSKSQTSPEPAQQHFQTRNLSLLVQGCAWIPWEVCSESGGSFLGVSH